MSQNSNHQASKILMGLTITSILIGIAVTVYANFPTASNKGYAPEQPIPFSHKLHAGTHKIDCKYCHLGVEKSRHHTVPPVNVCMNCHSVVKTDSPWIQKIKEHYDTGKPIEWVRVHELPDFVFFNHKPHVGVGISCETCHGDVKGMERVYQASPLTMGWCLDCHRGMTTPPHVINTLRPDIKNIKDAKGEQFAPINCSTCHY